MTSAKKNSKQRRTKKAAERHASRHTFMTNARTPSREAACRNSRRASFWLFSFCLLHYQHERTSRTQSCQRRFSCREGEGVRKGGREGGREGGRAYIHANHASACLAMHFISRHGCSSGSAHTHAHLRQLPAESSARRRLLQLSTHFDQKLLPSLLPGPCRLLHFGLSRDVLPTF